jgi:hypothetical protein
MIEIIPNCLFLIGSIRIVHVENDIREMTIVSWRQVEQNRDGWQEQLGSPLYFLDSGVTEEKEEEKGKEKIKNKKKEKRKRRRRER